MAVFSFLASAAGRGVRIVAGIALIAIGLFVVEGPASWVLEMLGLVPLIAGLFDFCVFAPLAGLPFAGSDLRETARVRAAKHQCAGSGVGDQIDRLVQRRDAKAVGKERSRAICPRRDAVHRPRTRSIWPCLLASVGGSARLSRTCRPTTGR